MQVPLRPPCELDSYEMAWDSSSFAQGLLITIDSRDGFALGCCYLQHEGTVSPSPCRTSGCTAAGSGAAGTMIHRTRLTCSSRLFTARAAGPSPTCTNRSSRQRLSKEAGFHGSSSSSRLWCGTS